MSTEDKGDALASLALAEYIAANEMAEDVGIAMTGAEEAMAIAREHAGLWFRDGSDTLTALAVDPAAAPQLVAQHLLRRATRHVETGLRLQQVWLKEMQTWQSVHDSLWRGMLLARRDPNKTDHP